MVESLQYVAERELGQGAFGKVYLVHNRRMEHFALKVLRGHQGEESLNREMQVLTRCSHPHLVKVVDFLTEVKGLKGIPESGPGLVLEYLSGPPLAEALSVASVEDWTLFLSQALSALAYLHRRELRHGDLKPSNFLLAKKRQLKLLDFGLAADTDPSAEMALSGSWDYLAPEALAGKPIPASDLFALAAVFYELAAGRRPYPAASLEAKFLEAPTPLSSLRPEIPEELSRLLARMMEPKREARIQSASAALKALRRIAPKWAVPSTGSEEPPAFVGRKAWRKELQADFAAWAAGDSGGSIWVLSGPLGVGRSRCLEEARWVALQAGIAVRELEEAFNKWPVAVVEEPVLFTVPDLHRLSEKRQQALVELLHQVRPRSYGVLLEFQDPAPTLSSAFRAWLASRSEIRQQRLPPFSLEESREFFGEAFGEAPPPETWIQDAHELSGGFPALLQALLLLFPEGPRKSRLRAAELEDLVWPATFKNEGREAWSQLKPDAQKLLLAIALPNSAVSKETLFKAFHRSQARWEAAMAALDAESWVEESAEKLRLKIPLWRSLLLAWAEKSEVQATARQLYQEMSREAGADSAALARLAEAAGLQAEFWHHGTRAAELRIAAGDAEEAVDLYQSLLKADLQSSEQAYVQAHLASALSRLGRFSEAAEAYENWYEAAEDDGSGIQTLKYFYLMGLNAQNQGQKAKAKKLYDRALAAAEPRRYPEHRPFWRKVLALRGRLEEAEGRLAEARRFFELGLEAGEEAAPEVAQLLRHRGLLELREGNREAARATWEMALAMSEKLGDEEGFANTAPLLADLAQQVGDYDRALEIQSQVLAAAEKKQDGLKQGRTLSNLASILIEAADYGRAVETAERAQAWLEKMGEPLDRWVNQFHLATLQVYLGEDAPAFLEEGRAAAKALGRGDLLAYLARLRGEACRLRRNYRDALENYRASREHFHAAGLPQEADMSRWQEVFTEALAGDLEAAHKQAKPEAHPHWRSLGTWFSRLDEAAMAALRREVPQEIELLALLAGAEALLRRGDAAAAERARGTAFDLLEALYRGLPEDRQIGFEQREDYRRLAEARKTRLKVEGLSREKFLAFAKINKRLNEEKNFAAVLEQVMDAAMSLAGAERGFLLLREPEGAEQVLPGFKVETARNLKRENLSDEEFKISLSVVEEALRRRVSLLTDDAQADPSFRQAESIQRYGLRSILALPLLGSGAALGVLYLDHRYEIGAFSEEKLLFLKAFADQAVLALDKARTLDELAQAKRALEHRVEEQDHELERIGMELAEARKNLRYGYEEIVGQSPAMLKLLSLLDRVVESRLPVWIHGESGTGKELIARALHFHGERKAQPFIAENCSAIPENLLESVLFGHVKGAFTHAEKDRMGLFEAADRGTIFLDEVGDMPMPMQAKLLRVLQEGEIRRVGSNRAVQVDVRVISATNKDLQEMVRAGKFREDLYFRLNGIRIQLPALRERREDIPPLVRHFLKSAAAESGKSSLGISEAALGLLAAYQWPGNIRELQNTVRNAVLFAEGDTVTTDTLSFKPELGNGGKAPEAEVQETVQGAEIHPEKEALLQALQRNGFHKGEAAKEMGISTRHLYNLLEKFDLPKNKWALKKLVRES